MNSHGTDYEDDPVAVAIAAELEQQGYLTPENYFDLSALAAATRVGKR